MLSAGHNGVGGLLGESATTWAAAIEAKQLQVESQSSMIENGGGRSRVLHSTCPSY